MSAPRVVTFGETMAMFRASQVGSVATESDFRLGIGGAESNVAIALARLGTTVTWLGRVGADGLGERVARELRAEGVDVRAITDTGAPTGLMVKENRTASTTRVTYYRAGSAGSRLSPADVAALDIPSAALLHVTGITPALSTNAEAAVEAAVDEAVAAGVPVSFDINHRAALWRTRDPHEVYVRLARRATIVFAGDDEARLLAPEATGPSELARAVTELGPDQVVIKLGGDGCLALIDGVEHVRAAVPIVALDTVGAGDAFVAGYLADLLTGAPVDERLTTAVAAGAFACLSPGDWEGAPRRQDLGLLQGGDPVQR